MNLKYASLSLAAAVVSRSTTAQLSSRPRRLGADAKVAKVQRKLSGGSSMSMAVAFADAATASESEQDDATWSSPTANSKSGKSTKSTKGIKCEQDEFLVARYGKQLCPSQVEDKFTKLEDTYIEARGLQNFLQPYFSTPIIDTFSTFGQVDLTREQAVSICVTKCENDPLCGAVDVQKRLRPPGQECEPYTGKPRYSCAMYNPDVGPGAYLQHFPKELADPVSGLEAVTFLKKSSSPLPSFDLVQCNIDGTSTNVPVAILCQLEEITDQETCDALLTDDWNSYMGPAIDCLFGVDGLATIFPCLECITAENPIKVEDVCPTDAGDNTTVIRDPAKCDIKCVSDQCEEKVATALLCIMGAPIIYDSSVNAAFGGVGVNSPESSEGHFEAFTCPLF